MNKYLYLEFSNAKLFRTHKGTKDFVNNITRIRRRDLPQFVEPITVHQVSNILHVLFGERPVNSIRDCFYESNEYLFKKALDSHLKINNVIRENGKGFIKEKTTLRKAVSDSFSKSVVIYWERFRHTMEDDFLELVNRIESIIEENPLNYPLKDICERMSARLSNALGKNVNEIEVKELDPLVNEIQDVKLKGLFFWLKSIKKTSVMMTLLVDHKKMDINQSGTYKMTVISSIDNVSFLTGEILVPVSDNDLLKIDKTCATILDGGLIYIKDIVNGNEINNDGFIKVKNISTEKVYEDKNKV